VTCEHRPKCLLFHRCIMTEEADLLSGGGGQCLQRLYIKLCGVILLCPLPSIRAVHTTVSFRKPRGCFDRTCLSPLFIFHLSIISMNVDQNSLWNFIFGHQEGQFCIIDTASWTAELQIFPWPGVIILQVLAHFHLQSFV